MDSSQKSLFGRSQLAGHSQSNQGFGSLSEDLLVLTPNNTTSYWLDCINPETIHSSVVEPLAKWADGVLSSQGLFGTQSRYLDNKKPYDSQSESQSSSGSSEQVDPTGEQDLFPSVEPAVGQQLGMHMRELFGSQPISSQERPLFDTPSSAVVNEGRFEHQFGQLSTTSAHDDSPLFGLSCSKRKHDSPGVSSRKKSISLEDDEYDDDDDDGRDVADADHKQNVKDSAVETEVERLSQKLNSANMFTPTKLKSMGRHTSDLSASAAKKMQDSVRPLNIGTPKTASRSSRPKSATSQYKMRPLSVTRRPSKVDSSALAAAKSADDSNRASSTRTRNKSNSSDATSYVSTEPYTPIISEVKQEIDDSCDTCSEAMPDDDLSRQERKKELNRISAQGYRKRKTEERLRQEKEFLETKQEHERLMSEMLTIMQKRRVVMDQLVILIKKGRKKVLLTPEVQKELDALMNRS
jgi:hypothetical protein